MQMLNHFRLFTVSTGFFALSLLSSFSQDKDKKEQRAADIELEFENKKMAAIQKYIADHPDAPDIDRAYSILVSSHLNLGKLGEVLDVLENRYNLSPKGEKTVLGTLLREIVELYVEIATQTGQKDRGRTFITKVQQDLKPHPEADQINLYIDQIAADLYVPGVGDQMELKFTATNGSEVDLAKLKGKVVLIDFWATWCVPCEQEMPNVKAAYEAFHDKGFEIIGVSLDDDLQALEKFMTVNGIAWPQFFDGNLWATEPAVRYGVKGIPATFLVGKEGKIVATNIRGAELTDAIKKELGLP